ncbi:MAG TPA: KGG domain-containing protein [Burkholderiales bacterium]|nr:KGG domain-containing protein [Burkholderiales bacterium]
MIYEDDNKTIGNLSHSTKWFSPRDSERQLDSASKSGKSSHKDGDSSEKSSHTHSSNNDKTSKSSKRNNQNKGTSNSNKGFASMDPEKQREIASKGGKAAHESGNAHEFDSEEAKEAGHKGAQHKSK